jgi:uncharacterized membrane protein YphA (DoxX/SURF4 family)
MQTTKIVLLAFLALIFLISGLSKASGNEKGLSGTREVNVSDWLARLTGVIEAMSALGLVLALKWSFFAYPALLTLWCIMAGAIFFHFRSDKAKTAFPAFFLLTLISITLVIN